MPLSNPTGFARVSRRYPRAFAMCSQCNYWFNRVDLVEQMEFQGNEVRPTGFFVCTRTCYDVPQPQLSTPVLPNDPQPIRLPQFELYQEDTTFNLASSSDLASQSTPISQLGALP
jgi:hypothetical protein